LKAQSPHLKVLLAVGGWDHGSGPFSDMVADNDLRQKFVSGILEVTPIRRIRFRVKLLKCLLLELKRFGQRVTHLALVHSKR